LPKEKEANFISRPHSSNKLYSIVFVTNMEEEFNKKMAINNSKLSQLSKTHIEIKNNLVDQIRQLKEEVQAQNLSNCNEIVQIEKNNKNQFNSIVEEREHKINQLTKTLAESKSKHLTETINSSAARKQ